MYLFIYLFVIYCVPVLFFDPQSIIKSQQPIPIYSTVWDDWTVEKSEVYLFLFLPGRMLVSVFVSVIMKRGSTLPC